MTSMFYAAQSLVMLQTLYGIIPNIHGKGECAKVCYLENDMSLIVRKPVFGVSDQVRHKPGSKTTENG